MAINEREMNAYENAGAHFSLALGALQETLGELYQAIRTLEEIEPCAKWDGVGAVLAQAHVIKRGLEVIGVDDLEELSDIDDLAAGGVDFGAAGVVGGGAV